MSLKQLQQIVTVFFAGIMLHAPGMQAQEVRYLRGDLSTTPMGYDYQHKFKSENITLSDTYLATITARAGDTIFRFSQKYKLTYTYPTDHSDCKMEYIPDGNITFECNYKKHYMAKVDGGKVKILRTNNKQNNAVYAIDIANLVPSSFYISGSSATIPQADLDKAVTDFSKDTIEVSSSNIVAVANPNQQFFLAPYSNQHNYRNIYYDAVVAKHPHFFYASVNYTPALSYRTIRINEVQFDHANEQQTRVNNEHSTFGYSADLRLGCSIHSAKSGYKSIHTIYGAFVSSRQGFAADDAGAINWKQGIDTGSSGNREYRFYYNGFGIGYNYTHYRHVVNFCADANLQYQWLSRISTNDTDYVQPKNFGALGLRKHILNAKFAAGISLRPRYWLDIHVLPVFIYDISSVNKASILRSNMYSFGLETGISFRMMHNKY